MSFNNFSKWAPIIIEKKYAEIGPRKKMRKENNRITNSIVQMLGYRMFGVPYCTILYCTFCTILWLYCSAAGLLDVRVSVVRHPRCAGRAPLYLLHHEPLPHQPRQVLYFTILYCAVLYHTVLCCTILYYAVLYHTVPPPSWTSASSA